MMLYRNSVNLLFLVVRTNVVTDTQAHKHRVKILSHRYNWLKLEIMYNYIFGINTSPSEKKTIIE